MIELKKVTLEEKIKGTRWKTEIWIIELFINNENDFISLYGI